MTWIETISSRLDDNKLARLGAVLWSQVGRKIELHDLSWALGLLGSNGDRLVLDALESGGALDQERFLRAPLLARWMGKLCGTERPSRLVWTLPSRHPLADKIGDTYSKALINEIGNAKNELILTSPFIQESGISSLLKVLTDALARGVVLVVLTHKAEDLASSQGVAVEELRREAIRLGKVLKVYTADVPIGSMLHAKLVIADGECLILGSANITWPGLEQNLEAGVVLNNGEAAEANMVISGLEKAGLARLIYDTGIGIK